MLTTFPTFSKQSSPEVRWDEVRPSPCGHGGRGGGDDGSGKRSHGDAAGWQHDALADCDSLSCFSFFCDVIFLCLKYRASFFGLLKLSFQRVGLTSKKTGYL